MKKVILMLAVGMFMFTSCKKETIEPVEPVVENPTDPVDPVVENDVPFHLYVSVEDDSWGTYGSWDIKVVLRSSTESLDSDTTSIANATDGNSTPNYATLNGDINDTDTFYVDLYNPVDNASLGTLAFKINDEGNGDFEVEALTEIDDEVGAEIGGVQDSSGNAINVNGEMHLGMNIKI